MTDKIDLELIDDEFPRPGRNNSSQGFRDNFRSINLNFERIMDNVGDLQQGVARVDQDTDYRASTASNLNLIDSTFAAFTIGEVGVDTEISFENGFCQTITVNRPINITFDDWPESKRYAYIRLLLKSDGESRTVTFDPKNTQDSEQQFMRYDAAWPSNLVINSSQEWTVVEFFTFDGGREIFSNYKGSFKETASDLSQLVNVQISNNALVKGDLEVQGKLKYNDLELDNSTDFVVNTNTVINGELSTSLLTTSDITSDTIAVSEIIGNNTDGELVITTPTTMYSSLKISGDILMSGTGGLQAPQGSTDERPEGDSGVIRFNTDKNAFEGHNGTSWSELGGVIDQDQDTRILAEQSPGSDDDILFFRTNGKLSASISSDRFEVQSDVKFKIRSTAPVTTTGTGALTVNGGVSVGGDLLVAGEILTDTNKRTSSTNSIATTVSNEATNTLTLTQNVDDFKAGDYIRIYGASEDNDLLTTQGLSLSVDVIGFAEPSDVEESVTFSYKIAQFDLDNGKISQCLDPVEVKIRSLDIENFNNISNIQLTFSRLRSSTGIVIYRKVGSQLDHKLVAVLGSKGFGGSTANLPWTDYYDYDIVDWSRKDDTNTFTEDSEIVHFPLVSPSENLPGWVDTVIEEINSNTSEVIVKDLFYSFGVVDVFRDDTPTLQNQIDLNSILNINQLTLETRNYFVKSLTLPPGFTIEGGGSNTVLTKLPWSARNENDANTILFLEDQAVDAVGFNAFNLLIDGNAQNQYLIEDVDKNYLNYVIYVYGKDITFRNIIVENVIGGGVHMLNENAATTDVVISQTKIRNGTLSDRYKYSPCLIQESSDISVTDNIFKNFPQYVNANAVSRGVIVNNIINNCGSGLFAYGVISTIINPNVLVGPGGEFLQGPDVLNSEFDAVNITLEPGTDYVSPALIYQESGELFDLAANQGQLSSSINEIRKVNGIEVISTDYSETTSGTPYISFDNSVNARQGELQFRIQQSLLEDLLSRANYGTLYENNENSLGIVYRIFQTEYVPLAEITVTTGSMVSDEYNGRNVYRIFTVQNNETPGAKQFSTNDVVRLVDHNTTPSLSGENGTIVNINTITGQVDIEFDFAITSPANTGSIALKNTFVVVKGKIN